MSKSALGVQQQILLAVGLAVTCYCLVLACVLCCRRRKSASWKDEESVFVASHPPEQVTVTMTPPSCTHAVKQQYEELDGDVLDRPSPKGGSSPSEDDLMTALPFDPCPADDPAERRDSAPVVPISPRRSSYQGRASLPTLTKLNLVSRSRRAMGRRSTVSGDGLLYTESSRLTRAAAQSGESGPATYGSGSLSTTPTLHFSLLYSAGGTLVVNILGLSGDGRRRSRVLVRASLPPLCPSPQQIASRRRSFSPDLQSQSYVLQVGSVEELRPCTLTLAVYSRDFSGLREVALGVVEVSCQHLDWEPDTTMTCSRQLSPTKTKLKKSLSSQETLSDRKTSLSVPRALGQVFVLLQYQTTAQRLKVMVRKAENLPKLTRIPGAPDHYVVINLRQDGNVVATKETKGVGGSNPVWNHPFLFDLPAGDVTRLLLEFIVMQGRLYTKSSILGRVMIGEDASEAGRGHWREMCSRGHIETARWHNIQSEALKDARN